MTNFPGPFWKTWFLDLEPSIWSRSIAEKRAAWPSEPSQFYTWRAMCRRISCKKVHKASFPVCNFARTSVARWRERRRVPAFGSLFRAQIPMSFLSVLPHLLGSGCVHLGLGELPIGPPPCNTQNHMHVDAAGAPSATSRRERRHPRARSAARASPLRCV